MTEWSTDKQQASVVFRPTDAAKATMEQLDNVCVRSIHFNSYATLSHQIPAARIPPKFSHNGLITLVMLQAPAQQTHMLLANYTRRLTSPATLQKGWYNTAPQEVALGLSRAHTILSTVSSNGPTTQASSTAEHIQRIHECSTKFLQPGIHPLNTE